ncbi:MAG: molybdopterin-synthase adenylyltransferase MoeB [Arenicella sp.]
MQLPPLVDAKSELNNTEIARYSRHLLIPEVGLTGQQRLKSSKVLVVGAGGLGSPTLMYLAAAGIGTIGILEFDIVEESNLQRQIIHGVSDIGKPKASSAAESIHEINPYISVIIHPERLENHNALEIIKDYDLVIDGTDNFATRYLVNDACVLSGKPYVWGSIFRFEGQASVFWEQAPNNQGINYRDLYPAPPPPEHAPSCSEGGIFGVLCASIASIMATEAIKLITGVGNSLLRRLVVYDALEMNYQFINLQPAPNRKPITELTDYATFCGLNRPSSSREETHVPSISVNELKLLRDQGTDLTLIDVRESSERNIASIDGAIHIPKGQILSGQIPSSLSKDKPIVVHCKMGGRSRDALLKMQEQGFTNIKNLDGGILAWINEIEPSLPRY